MGCIFDTEEGKYHISLIAYTSAGNNGSARLAEEDCRKKVTSPRMEDDSDVLQGCCDYWRHKAPDGNIQLGGGTLDEMRFQQLQEVDAIKRVLARKNQGLSLNPGVL